MPGTGDILQTLANKLGGVAKQVIDDFSQVVSSLPSMSPTGSISLEAQITVGVDDSFIIDGLSTQSLENSIYIKPDNVIDFQFNNVGVGISLPTSESSQGDFSADGCCSWHDVQQGLNQVGNDSKGAIAGAVDLAHVIGGDIEHALGQLLDASLSVGLTGNFNLSLADPNGNDMLTASQILSLISGPSGLAGLLSVSGGVGGGAQGKGRHIRRPDRAD